MDKFNFPPHLYTDVRIENVVETKIYYLNGKLEELKEGRYRTSLVRIFDGERWYYASVSNEDRIQEAIDSLATMTSPQKGIHENPIVEMFEAHTGAYWHFRDQDLAAIPVEEKARLLQSFFPLVSTEPLLKLWQTIYVDNRTVKEFFSSKGAALTYDTQRCGFQIRINLADGEKTFSEAFQPAGSTFDVLVGREEEFKRYLEKCKHFLQNSQPISPGLYTVILSPLVAGIFAHESFGHKSEADFMVGDETMRQEWSIGKKVGAEILTIADDGNIPGSGFLPFDDEGTKTRETFLIKNGVLAGRLHSVATAVALGEEPTGNARAVNFEHQPVVRMTTTYILPGSMTKEELFGSTTDGLYIETIKHGSGLSTFTLAPSLAYRIKNGEIKEPVQIAVLTGNVFETLGNVDGLSDQVEMRSFVLGGCGKMDQFPLPVGFGGPYMRIRNMSAQ